MDQPVEIKAQSSRCGHPCDGAVAIVAETERRGRAAPTAKDFGSVTGKGVTGQIGGKAVAIADPIKATAEGAIAALRTNGVEIVMATGDNAAIAAAVGGAFGIARIEAELFAPGQARADRAVAGPGSCGGDGRRRDQ